MVQERHFKRLLAMGLVEIGGRVKDATAFKEAYDAEVKVMRQGEYEWPEYDGSGAQGMHKSLLESGKLIDYAIWVKLSGRNYVPDGPQGARLARERVLATVVQRMATQRWNGTRTRGC